MARAYGMELRDRAVKFVLAGESRHAVARRLGLGVSTVIRWLDRHQKTGTAAAVKIGLKVDYKTMWKFVHAQDLSFKKNRLRSRTTQT
jgi:putative transposase